MIMKPTLKELAHYLPYKLEIASPVMRKDGGRVIRSLEGRQLIETGLLDNAYLPVLYPMKDLLSWTVFGTPPIVELVRMLVPDFLRDDWYEHRKFLGLESYNESASEFYLDKGRFVLIDSTKDCNGCPTRTIVDINQMQLYDWLFEHHFDVFDLISQGKAIDINTL